MRKPKRCSSRSGRAVKAALPVSARAIIWLSGAAWKRGCGSFLSPKADSLYGNGRTTWSWGACAWLIDWYPAGRELRIPLSEFNGRIVSFTYGDTFPAMRYQDGKPTRGQVYSLAELPGLVEQYGLPQDWNAEGKLGPDRYIEAQVWADEPLRPYLSMPSH